MIRFNEADHTYTTEDGKVLISVTQLMKKHGLSPDYGAVPAAVLSAKAERGTLIHKEIEDYIKYKVIGFTTELANFITYIKENNIKVIHSELRVYNDICAGTIDLILEQNGEYIQADIKTTATLHKDSVSWQNSIYTNIYNAWHNDTIVKVTKSQAFHFDKDGNLKVVDTPYKPSAEVEKLFQCEREGKQYKQESQETTSLLNEITLLDQQAAKDLEEKTSLETKALEPIKDTIQEIEKRRNEAVTKANALREQLLNAMESNNIKTIENDVIRVTYVDPSTRTTIDSAKLKKELPEVAGKYSKTTTTKASLRITLKKEIKVNE